MAAVLHDAAYGHKLRTKPFTIDFTDDHTTVGEEQEWKEVSISRKDADGLFYRVMRESKTRRWRAWVMYCAVRGFGRSHWTESDS